MFTLWLSSFCCLQRSNKQTRYDFLRCVFFFSNKRRKLAIYSKSAKSCWTDSEIAQQCTTVIIVFGVQRPASSGFTTFAKFFWQSGVHQKLDQTRPFQRGDVFQPRWDSTAGRTVHFWTKVAAVVSCGARYGMRTSVCTLATMATHRGQTWHHEFWPIEKQFRKKYIPRHIWPMGDVGVLTWLVRLFGCVSPTYQIIWTKEDGMKSQSHCPDQTFLLVYLGKPNRWLRFVLSCLFYSNFCLIWRHATVFTGVVCFFFIIVRPLVCLLIFVWNMLFSFHSGQFNIVSAVFKWGKGKRTTDCTDCFNKPQLSGHEMTAFLFLIHAENHVSVNI